MTTIHETDTTVDAGDEFVQHTDFETNGTQQLRRVRRGEKSEPLASMTVESRFEAIKEEAKAELANVLARKRVLEDLLGVGQAMILTTQGHAGYAVSHAPAAPKAPRAAKAKTEKRAPTGKLPREGTVGAKILDALADGPQAASYLVQATSASPAVVQSTLLNLVGRGLVTKSGARGSMLYSRSA